MPEKRISVVPPVVSSDDLEDFLATDDLFIDYFNAFLQLPTFPEPLVFNKDRGGFEVVDDAQDELKSRLRSVARAQQKRKPIYDPPHQVLSERTPPIMPWHHEQEQHTDLKTSFRVKCLNKEQGIQWIKEERLPSFLKSDYYLEYRLAKLVSQAEVAPKGSNAPLNLYIDPDYRPFHIEKPAEEEEVIVDKKKLAMRDMFVCMGDAGVTHTDNWFSQVKLSSSTNTTRSLSVRPSNLIAGDRSSSYREARAESETGCNSVITGNSRPSSGCSGGRGKSRPLSGVSSGFGDSGIWSLETRDTHSVTFDGEISNREQLLESPLRPRSPPTWRPPIGDNVCVIAEGVGGSGYIGGVTTCGDGVHQIVGEVSTEEARTVEKVGSSYISETVTCEGGIHQFIGDVSTREEAQTTDRVKDRDTDRIRGGGYIGEAVECGDGLHQITRDALSTEETQTIDSVVGSSYIGEAGTCQKSGDLKTGAAQTPNIRKMLLINDTDQNEGTNLDQHHVNCERPKDKPQDVILVHNLESIASLLVSHVLKKILHEVYNQPLSEVDLYLNEHILLGSKFDATMLDEGCIDRVRLAPDFGDGESGSPETCTQELDQSSQPEEGKKPTSKAVSISSSSDDAREQGEADSCLGSDVDDSPSDDGIFSERPQPVCDLNSMRGIKTFQSFLCGTTGVKYWNLWLDVDKGRSVQDPLVQHVFLSQMRDRYLLPGGPCEIPLELRDGLGLAIPSDWTSIPKLISLQDKLIRPLLLYWAPRFLMKMNYQCDPGVDLQQRKLNAQITGRESNVPKPRTKPLLPLRPKTCVARLRTSTKTRTRPAQTAPSRLVSRPKSAIGIRRGPTVPLHNGTITSTVPKAPHGQGHTAPLHRQAGSRKEPSNRLGGVSGKGDVSRVNHIRKKNSQGNGSCDREIGACTSSDMKALLEGLLHEGRAGGYFLEFVKKHYNNQALVNALNCWHEIQDYHTLFWYEMFSPYVVTRRAEEIHSKFIVEGSLYPIDCPARIQAQVCREVIPPFEELFDGVEEHILALLVEPWGTMKESDKNLYNKIHLTGEERQLQGVTSSHLRKLQKRLNRERMFTPDFHIDEEGIEGRQEAQYNSLAEKVPAEYKDYDFNQLIHNRLELEHFRAYLDDNYASVDLLCWLDIESFRRTSHLQSAKRDQKAREIKTKYLNKKYFFGPNSPATRKQQNEVMMSGGGWGKLLLDRPPTPILLEAQKYICQRLERKWLPLFLCTEEFQARQKPTVTLGDITDDLLLNRRKRSQAIYKILESRWVSSSREITGFRQALQSPLTCQQFRRFISVKGDNLENDVLFWLEVQKFKDMYHDHTEESLIHQKILAMIRCFIDSEIQPGLHIDITPEQVEKILEKRPKEMGPYVFRDAQLTVFRVLFSHWSDFLRYRNSIADDKLLEDLEKKKRRKKKKEEEEQKRLEEEKEQKAPRSKRDSQSSRRMSHFTNVSVDFLDDDEEEKDEKVEWKYSNYIRGLEREQALLDDDQRAESIMTSIESLARSQHEDAELEDKSSVTGTISIGHTPAEMRKNKKRVTLPDPGSKLRRGSREVHPVVNRETGQRGESSVSKSIIKVNDGRMKAKKPRETGTQGSGGNNGTQPRPLSTKMK